MTTADLRVAALSLRSTADSTRTLEGHAKHAADGTSFDLTGHTVEVLLGDVAQDVVIDGDLLTIVLVTPGGLDVLPLTMTFDDAVVAAGSVYPSELGTDDADIVLDLTIGEVNFDLSIIGGAVSEGSVISVNGRAGVVTGLAEQDDLDDEVAERGDADTALATSITNEASVRAAADTSLDVRLDAIEALGPLATDSEVAAAIAAIPSNAAAGTSSLRSLGTTGTTAAAGNDARLSDTRTPTAHAASHQDGGADELALDASQIATGTLADARIPSGVARDSEVTSAISAHAAATDPHADRAYADGIVATEASSRSAADLLLIPLTQKGASNGVAPLDGSSLIPTSYLPALAITSTFVVGSQVAMLALTAQEGDVAVRTDQSKSYILTASPASTLGNWQELLSPTDAVQSVDGRTGTVSLSDLYDAAGAAAAAQAFAIQRTNHSGNQAIATVTGLQAALDGKATAAEGATVDTAVQPARTITAGTGLTGGGDLSANRTLAADFGTGAGKVTQGNDSRLSDARTPTAHASSHASAGGDPVTLAQSQITNLTTDLAAKAPVASPVFTGNPQAPTPSTSDNDTSVATTAMVQAAIAAYVAAQDVMVFKGVIDASANPNYPAADAGHMYKISVAGKIGGASGVSVEAGDSILCITDGTAAGNQATVGANWVVIQVNIDGAVVGPASATDGHIPQYDGTSGKLLKDALALDTDTTLAANSDARVASQKAAKAHADAKVAQTITNGVTTSAPSQDAVFDALALKADTSALGTAAAANTGTGSTNVPTIAQADARYRPYSPRVTTITSSATPTYNTDTCDVVKITALAAAITSMVTNKTGTPVDEQRLQVVIEDDGTPRAVAWGADFENAGVTLPSTTVSGKRTRVGLIYNAATTGKWGCVAVVTEA